MRKTVLFAVVLAGAIAPAEASAVPHFIAPWPCGETRDYYHHSSEVSNALDFNLAGPLYDREGMLLADCDLRAGLHAKRWFDAVGHYSRADVLVPPER